SAFEAAERPHELLLQLGRKGVLGEGAAPTDRLSHLVEVVRTPVAVGEVHLEGLDLAGLQRSFEVVGDELDDLAAGDVLRRAHDGSSTYPSSAARTFARAR